MYHTIQCVKCGNDLKVRAEYVGRGIRCPHCQAAQVVSPLPQEAAGPATVVPLTRMPALGRRAVRIGQFQGTSVNLWLTGAIAASLTLAFYLALHLFVGRGYFFDLLADRGWTQHGCVFLAFWAGAFLFEKWRKLRYQQRALLLDLLPDMHGRDITAENVNWFIAHVRKQPYEPGRSFLVNRVLRSLEHFRAQGSGSEATALLGSQSDIDANAVTSSYTMVKVFIWAIPILGFLGTVQGIGDAVQAFSGNVNQAQELDQVKNALGDVTKGLSKAFETTLLALVISILVMFPVSSTQKAEEDLLNTIDDYCNENLMMRLARAGGGPAAAAPAGTDPAVLRQAIDAALVPHHAQLEAWFKKLEGVGAAVTRQVAGGWEAVLRQFQAAQATQATQMTDLLQAVARDRAAAQAQAEAAQRQASADLAGAARGAADGLARASQQVAEELVRASREITTALASTAADAQARHAGLAESARAQADQSRAAWEAAARQVTEELAATTRQMVPALSQAHQRLAAAAAGFANVLQGQQALEKLQHSMATNLLVLTRSDELHQTCASLQTGSDRLAAVMAHLERQAGVDARAEDHPRGLLSRVFGRNGNGRGGTH